MKQIKFFAVALAALTLFSCSKETNENPDEVSRVLTVKIANPASTKATGTPGSSTEGTISLENGVIFTLNGDAVVNAYVLNAVDVQSATGQPIPDKITSATTVFIVANVPTVTVTEWTASSTRPTTLDAIKAAQFAISAENGKNYKKATLCNTDATVVVPTALLDGEVEAAVELSPVYSRLELPSVTAEGNITSFSVTGVYVDDFYSSYTVGGSFDGPINTMGVTPPASWVAEGTDEGNWASVANVATPGGANVWAYNLPSGNLPRLVIKLENVTVSGVAMTGTWYLTVKSYTGIVNNIFEPGNIYNITDGIKFDEKHIGPTPNPTENDLWVSVTIKQWTINDVGVNI